MKEFECQMITEADFIGSFIFRERMEVETMERGFQVTTLLD